MWGPITSHINLGPWANALTETLCGLHAKLPRINLLLTKSCQKRMVWIHNYRRNFDLAAAGSVQPTHATCDAVQVKTKKQKQKQKNRMKCIRSVEYSRALPFPCRIRRGYVSQDPTTCTRWPTLFVLCVCLLLFFFFFFLSDIQCLRRPMYMPILSL